MEKRGREGERERLERRWVLCLPAAPLSTFFHPPPPLPFIQMPLEPNQVPCAGQRRPLPTSRIPSTIPKAGVAEGGTWVYPSPQMFFNALARKGKGADVKEEDMESVVHAHNCELTGGEEVVAAFSLIPLSQPPSHFPSHSSSVLSHTRLPPPHFPLSSDE